MRALGIQVIDADAIAHQLTSGPGETLEKIASVLGEGLLDERGGLDRAKVAALAFSDKRFLDTLSGIVHEEVIRSIDEQLEEARERKVQAIALDVPIPVQRGFLDVCDQVWTVTADQAIRLGRLQKRGMDPAEALRRMEIQMTPDEYRAIASHEIVNNGTLIELEERVRALLMAELGERGIRIPGLPV